MPIAILDPVIATWQHSKLDFLGVWNEGFDARDVEIISPGLNADRFVFVADVHFRLREPVASVWEIAIQNDH